MSYWHREGKRRFHIRFDGGNIDGAQYIFERASSASYTDENGVLKKSGASADIPRFEALPSLQFPDVSGSGRLYLHEMSTTNYLKQSEDFTAANWVATGLTVTANQTTAPDNTVTADKLAGAAVGDKIEQTVSATVSRRYCFSVWLKADVATTVTIELVPDGTAPTPGSQVCSVTTSWKRFKVKAVTDADSTVITARIITDANTVYAWGAQLEYEEMTSYIPTTTVAVTRAQDKLKIRLPNWFDINWFQNKIKLILLLNIAQLKFRPYRGLIAFGGNNWASVGGGVNYVWTSGADARYYFVPANNGVAKYNAVIIESNFPQYLEYTFEARHMYERTQIETPNNRVDVSTAPVTHIDDISSDWRHWMEVGSYNNFDSTRVINALLKEIILEPARYGERI